ncbi:MAG: 3-hydroxyacyl-CoA dehydrogenase family protein [Candidatus Kapaibacterium sp.]|jgi:3-hydroxybutyryl-CoA dehydrogenase
MRVQLISDPEYVDGFTGILTASPEIEIVHEAPEIVFDATFVNIDAKLKALGALQDSKALIISNTLTLSATLSQKTAGTSAQIVGAPILPNYFGRQQVIEISRPLNSSNKLDSANSFFALLSKKTETIGDAIGGVFPRTLSMIINEAAFALQEKVATAEDIDLAMKLGTNYPKGPLAWCDEIGAAVVVAILDALGKEYGSDRYRVAALLRRHAEAGINFYA